jgi:hypothetical protein
MRVLTTEAFNKFLLANSQQYPYNSLHATRASFFCKWVMPKGRSAVTGLTEYFPTLANSYSNGVLLEMIRNGEAKPLPLELSQIMDSMRWWGRRTSFEWHGHVVYVLSQALDNGLGGHNTRDFVRKLISLHISEMIQVWFDVHSLAYNLVFMEWINWFNNTYSIGSLDGQFCFRWVAIKSFDRMEAILDELNQGS